MIYSFVHRILNYKRTEPVSQQRLRGDNYFSMMSPEALTHFWRRRLWRDNYVFSSVESIKLWQVPKENKDSKKKKKLHVSTLTLGKMMNELLFD